MTAFTVFIITLIYPFSREGLFIRRLEAFWCRMMLGLSGIKLDVKGVENIPGKGPVVFLSNHQGAFDIPVLGGVIPLNFRWIAKKSLFSVPLIGWAMRMAGHIPIDRENPADAYKSMEDALERIKTGKSVVIFPEGTRGSSDALLPFKRGAFLLAAKSGVPVVPVAIKGTREILEKGSWKINPSSVHVSFGPPINTAGGNEKELRNVTKDSIKRMLGW